MKSFPRNYFLFTFGVLLLAGCGPREDGGPKLEAFPVRVEKLTRQNLEDALSVVGSLKAKNEATLYSRVPGKLLKNVLKEGEAVKKGQTVALVERDEVGVEFKPAPVPSTLDGVVGRTYLDEGADVKTDTPVALVLDTSELIARAEVPERYAGRVRVGQAVRIGLESLPDRSFIARVSRVSPAVDPVTRSLPLEARLENSGGLLKSGMFVQVSVVTEHRAGVLSVPAEALVNGSGPAVFVFENGKAVKREVEVGLRTENRVEVRKGLNEGDQVITFGLFALKDGSPVELIEGTSSPVE
ncbi:MAG TPA: efflux RND transporter periplasmic adaptor subunit [Elusimicrobiota bacterium]|nr:efflux RND transporter periplasmic adaptor subunit [Elusimicrobiota bacterium]